MPSKNKAEATVNKTPQTNGEKKERTPAVDLLVKFLSQNDIVLIVDETNKLSKDADGLLYTVNPTKRLRAFYSDQLNEQGENKDSKVDIPGN